MRLMQLMFAASLGMASSLALAGETAYTVRPVELKAKPFADADTLANLAEKSGVEVVARQGSWNQVKANGATGWVKMLSLRFGDGTQKKTGDSGLGALFNVASTGSSGSTTTTGVRGLSEEKLRNPHPDPQALQQLGDLAASQAEAQQFAKSGNLSAAQMDYLPAPAKRGKEDE